MFDVPFMFRLLVKPLISLIIGIAFLACGIKIKPKGDTMIKNFILENKKTLIAFICMLFSAILAFVGVILEK